MLTPATATAGSMARRADTLALSIGSRITVSTLMLACVLVICAGASSMLNSLHKMDADLQVVNEQLAVTNKANDILNNTLQSLPPMSEHLKSINGTIARTNVQVGKSAKALTTLAGKTTQMNVSLDSIASDTGKMGTSLKRVDSGAATLGATVDDLDTRLAPLVVTQHQTLLEARHLPVGIYAMNDRLAYVIRQLNYISHPPQPAGLAPNIDGSPHGFTVGLELPPGTLPKVPFLKAVADPAEVFPYGVWDAYTGP